MDKIKPRNVIARVFNKSLGFDALMRCLQTHGVDIYSSTGTYKHIKEKLELSATDLAELTGQGPILGHRVVTLVPQVHAGLLSTPPMSKEMEDLGWSTFDMVIGTFYPLAKTMDQHPDDPDKINENVDIGGPTMIRSATKGNRIVVVDENDFDWVIQRLNSGGFTKQDIAWLQAKAIAAVAAYVATETVFRTNGLRPE